VAQDERIVMIVYNDETLEKVGKRSPLDRKMLADALTAIDAMNPKAIGIDILIDQAQPEDPLLIDAFRRMKTPTYLAFASNATNPEYMQYWQEQFLTNFLRQVSSGPVRPTSIMLEPDIQDGVIRSWPNQPRSLPPLMGNSMTPIHPEFRNYTRSIEFRLPKNEDEPVFSKLPIENFTEDWAAALRPMVEGRYVLIGGDIQDQDDYETPMSRSTGQLTKGLEVHAHLLAQLLDGRMPGEIPGWSLWIAALGVVTAGGLTSLLEMRSWKLGAVLVAQVIFFVALPFYLQTINVDTQSLPAFGWGVGWALAFAALGTAARAVGSEQRRFAQATLGKYLPPDVAAQILKEPERLSLRGEKRQIYAMFTDLEGFTKLSHAITPEQLSTLLNRYLDVLSDTVLRHGGTIDKFVGDAVVAFWGAPIAREDDADRAVQAAIAMYEAGEEFKKGADADLPAIGCTRVGLHRGEAVVGNFGGEGRIQYTALGDGMNTAARLESANKSLKTTALVSNEVKVESTLDVFRPMGRIVLSGRATPVEVWEPKPSMPTELRQKLVNLWERFETGDLAALAELEQISGEHKDDAALANFVYRIREAGPGGHFVLGSK
jgi:adenylate cyclase